MTTEGVVSLTLTEYKTYMFEGVNSLTYALTGYKNKYLKELTSLHLVNKMDTKVTFEENDSLTWTIYKK